MNKKEEEYLAKLDEVIAFQNHYGWLEKENAKLKKQLSELSQLKNLCSEELQQENMRLKKEVEELKCCMMCKFYDFNQPNYCHKGVYRERQIVCSNWQNGNKE